MTPVTPASASAVGWGERSRAPLQGLGLCGEWGGFYGAAAGGGKREGKWVSLVCGGLGAPCCVLPPSSSRTRGRGGREAPRGRGTAQEALQHGAGGGCHLWNGSEPPLPAWPLRAGLGRGEAAGTGVGLPAHRPMAARGVSTSPTPREGQSFRSGCSVIGVACCFRAGP